MSYYWGKTNIMYKLNINGERFENPNPKITGSEIKTLAYAPSNKKTFWKNNYKEIADNEYVKLDENNISYFYIKDYDIVASYRELDKARELHDKRILSGKNIINYIDKEHQDGKRKFIISFPYEDKRFIIHPDGKDGETFDGSI